MGISKRPPKRPRLSTSAIYDNVPDIDKVRHKNDLRLKGRMQAIFDKYERDFTGIADEIDLRTMEIVVDNGHLVGMQHERDITSKKTQEGANARRTIRENFENDELGVASAKDKVSNAEHPASNEPLSLIGLLVTAVTNRCQDGNSSFGHDLAAALRANGMFFDPHDLADVEELARALASELAKKMKSGNLPPVDYPATWISAIPTAQTLTPPVSDNGSESPHMHFQRAEPHSHYLRQSRPLSENEANTYPSAEGGYTSVWAASVDSTPEPELEISANDEQQQSKDLPTNVSNARKEEYCFWSKEEDNLLLQLAADETMTWSLRSLRFPKRTATALRRRMRRLRSQPSKSSPPSGHTAASDQVQDSEEGALHNSIASEAVANTLLFSILTGDKEVLKRSLCSNQIVSAVVPKAMTSTSATNMIVQPVAEAKSSVVKRLSMNRSSRKLSSKAKQDRTSSNIQPQVIQALPGRLSRRASKRQLHPQSQSSEPLLTTSTDGSSVDSMLDSSISGRIGSPVVDIHQPRARKSSSFLSVLIPVNRSVPASKHSNPVPKPAAPIPSAAASAPKHPTQASRLSSLTQDLGTGTKEPQIAPQAHPSNTILRIDDIGSDDELG